MFLELLDFPPFLWTFDAHALWHLSTCVLPYFWYRCVRLFNELCINLENYVIVKIDVKEWKAGIDNKKDEWKQDLVLNSPYLGM